MEFNTEITVDVNKVREFIESDKFIQFLLNNTTDFSTAVFILQTINDALPPLDNT